MIKRLKDTSGKPSTTLTFVVIAFVAILIKFIGAEIGPIPPMSASEFGAAVMAILAPWVVREFKEKWTG